MKQKGFFALLGTYVVDHETELVGSRVVAHVEGDDRAGEIAGVAVVGSDEANIHREAVVLLTGTSQVSGSRTSDGVVVVDGVVEVGADGHVEDRQRGDTPLVAITGTSAENAIALEAGQHTDSTLLHGITLSEDVLNGGDTIGEVEHLVTPLVALVLDVVEVLLGELADKALDAGVTDNVELTEEVVGLHHNIEVTEQVLTLQPVGGDNVGTEGVEQRVGHDLSLGGGESSESSLVESGGELVDVLHHLGLEVALDADFVVHVHRRSHSEAPGVGGEGELNHSGSVLTVRDSHAASVTDADVGIVVDNRSLKGVADRGASLLDKLRSENTVRVLALVHEEIQCTVATRAELELIQARVGPDVLNTCVN